VTSPTPITTGPVLSAAGHSASTTVTLSSLPVGAGAVSGRVWYYARTAPGTTLRVEAVWAGAAHAAGNVAAGSGYGWRSFPVTVPNQAALNDLQLRFVSTGPSAQLRAAYATITRAGQAVRLHPDGIPGRLVAHPTSTAARILAKAVTQPAAITTGSYLAAATPGNTTTVTLNPPTNSGGAQSSRAWFYAGTGAGTQLRLEVVSRGSAVAAVVLRPGTTPAWHAVSFPTANTRYPIGLRMTAVGGAHATIRAAYVQLDVPIPNRDQINAYIGGLTPIAAGQEQPDHPVGATSAPMTSDPLPDPTAPTGFSKYSCTTTPYSLSTSPDKIVSLDPDANKLWLGGLLQGQGYVDGLGSLRELPIRQRAPLKLYIDLLGKGVTETVPHPDAASMQQAISDLVLRATAAKTPVPAGPPSTRRVSRVLPRPYCTWAFPRSTWARVRTRSSTSPEPRRNPRSWPASTSGCLPSPSSHRPPPQTTSRRTSPPPTSTNRPRSAASPRPIPR
jgi:hypothetical protein